MKLGTNLVVAAALLIALAGCAPAAGSETTASTHPPASPTATEPSPTPTPTAQAVTWVDPQALIMLPNASTPDHLPHGPSWASADGKLECGIYDDWDRYSPTAGDLGPGVFYGCRIAHGANTFTYPPTPGSGEIGGCPSGFAANAGEAAATLCNSGQVFSGETGGAVVLQPGQGVRFAGIGCVALPVGMACTETSTGHGFRTTLSDFTLT